MDLWFEWEENNEEHFSFEDSDRFEEDSLCSWISEPESICANWRGWKRSCSQSQNGGSLLDHDSEGNVESLIELCARTVAIHIPFETVERTFPQIPEQMQLRIAFWSFPLVEDDIRLYSCLANGSSEEFQRGEHLVKAKAVKDALQIGFHLSATVNQLHSVCQTKGMFNVAVTFDRGCITSSNCTCDQTATWCAHVIALCLFRIYHSNLVCLRAPVSEYLSRLRRDQLQKFAQYLISELPQQILPTAQRLLDELLSSQESAINTVSGAPDPTAGPAESDQSKWCLDEKALHESVRKMLGRFCGPGPLVFSDVNAMYLSTTAPPTAAEWSNLLRPLRGREPEGMWNLLYIVRELFHRGDTNAVGLLSILTEECLSNDQVIIWWFDSRSQSSGASNHRNHANTYRTNNNAASTEATKHACAGFCDEIVVLWRLAALNPQLTDEERLEIKVQLEEWHSMAVAKARAGHGGGFTAAVSCFLGFQPAIEACSLDWSNVDIGIPPDRPSDASDSGQPITLSCGRGKLPHIGVKARRLTSCSADAEMEDIDEGLSDLLIETEPTRPTAKDKKTTSPVPLQEIEEDLEVLCARGEALHVHGYTSEASKLAIRLANKILSDRAKIDTTAGTTKKKERASNRASGAVNFTSTTLVKAAFLCGVLAEDPLLHHLAFKVGMFGLEMPRQPARSKALEVKLTNQEAELVALLKKLPLGGEEMMGIREKANLICQGKLRREAVLPTMLATFIFEMLCVPSKVSRGKGSTAAVGEERKLDEELGYKTAVCALGMKPNVLETDYPILCEGIRRQRGDLAIALLLHCKDNATRLREVKEVLLDKSRYEGPSFVNEVERSAPRPEQERKKTDDTEGGYRMRGGFGLPPRRTSSGQSSSSTSDSGTDSSRGSLGDNRARSRAAVGKPSAKVTVTLHETIDDESGSSSGVDTDSAVNANSLPKNTIAVEVKPGPSTPQTTQGGKVVVLARRASCSTEEDEALSISPKSPESCLGRAGPPGKRPQESRGRGASNLESREQRARRTSDLDGSDIEIDIDDNEDDMGGMSLTPEQGRMQQAAGGRQQAAQGRQQAVEVRPAITARIVGSVGLPPFDKDPVSRRELAAATSKRTGKSTEDDDPVGDDSMGALSSEPSSSSSSLGTDNAAVATTSAESAAACSSGEPVLSSHGKPNSSQAMPCISHSLGRAAAASCGGAGAGAVSGVVEAAQPASAAAGPSGDSAASASADDAEGNNGRSGRRHGNGRTRRKKKGKKSAVSQATEAEAHFMFELAKTVLNKAGGASTSSVFSQTSNNTSHSGPHRGLQLCAFEIGLCALGLHNRTSPNWLSRTYSSHVSWISGQAMEIGSYAIQLLVERWETNLTPSEVASIADRASRSNDPTMVKAAAELALSCLPMAHMLNPGEIQRALTQCREQDPQHLDRACQAVESAARGGGVYPEVLFEVAKHWYYLHEQNQATAARPSHKEGTRNRNTQPARQQQQQQQQQQATPSSASSTNMNPFLQQIPHPSYNSLPPPPYATPEQYVQMQMHQQVTQMMGHYQGGAFHANPHYGYSFNTRQIHGNQFQFSSAYGGLPPPYQSPQGPSVSQLSSRSLNQTQNGPVPYYLNNAYRVGMLALESISRRTPDDRPNVKFSRNPPCSDDIRWLCTLSARLGTSYLQRFCVSCLDAVVSPFVLHDLALDAARHLARSNPAQLAINLRSPNISPLVQKSLTMYVQCIRYHLVNIVQSEYEEFVELLRHARRAFCMVPGGMTQFNDLLQSIRRGYPKKKDLWQMIMTGLAKA